MSTVSFKRSANVNEIPIVDGQLVFDETHNKIYMDNGTKRLQYGGDVSLIEDTSYATSNNTFSANGSLNLFTQKLSVIDNKDSALAATEQHVPVGCLAFQSVIGNTDYSGVGNTVSDSLVTLKNNITNINGQLVANENTIYMDYHDGKYGVNTSPTRGADTFVPFKGYEYLGTSTTYNLSNRSDYTNLTNSNFVVVITSIYESGYTENWLSDNAKGSFGGSVGRPYASYNASTGVLQILNTSVSGATGRNLTSNTLSFGVQVYLFY